MLNVSVVTSTLLAAAFLAGLAFSPTLAQRPALKPASKEVLVSRSLLAQMRRQVDELAGKTSELTKLLEANRRSASQLSESSKSVQSRASALMEAIGESNAPLSPRARLMKGELEKANRQQLATLAVFSRQEEQVKQMFQILAQILHALQETNKTVARDIR